ncbi:MAG: zinc ribbon domain-containing protein [Syntrophobacter sp.]
MPLFEYECHNCSEHFETLVLKSDEIVSCPKCNSAEVHKMLSVCGFKTGGGKGGAPNGAQTATASHSHSGGCSCCGPRPRVVQKRD